MHRSTPLLAALALAGCGSEDLIIEHLPVVNPDNARPVESKTKTDIVVQTVNPTVDILYMVDNSCSMSNDQDDLAANFPVFMQHFLNSGLQYHIGVVSSDIVDPGHSGKLQKGFNKKWIEPTDNNQIAMFTQMAVLGAGGHFPEKGISGVYQSMNDRAAVDYNRGFFRDDSALHVICVSDEKDYSSIPPLNEFIGWFDGLRRSADDRSFSAIENPNAHIYSSPAKSYGAVTQQIGGVMWDIRVDDWSPALDILGLKATGLKSEYFLSELPVEDSIEVAVATPVAGEDYFSRIVHPRAHLEGEDWVEGDWFYTPGRNSITFLEDVPDELARIEITYTILSSVVSEQL